MPPGVRGDLELDIASALRGIDRIESTLSRATQAFGTGLARAIDAIAGTEVDVDADASDVTSSVDAAVDAADSDVDATAEASGVTGSIDAAVDAADTGVDVTGEAGEVTGSIDAAVDAADTDVAVTGDASDVTGSIDAAVQAATTSVTIEAETSGLDTAADEIGDVSEGLSDAAGQAPVLVGGLGNVRSALGGIGAAVAGVGAVQFFRSSIDAASDLDESISKVTVVFGDAVGEVRAFGETASQSVGLAQQEALEFAGTFGNLFTALGLSKEAAADLAPEVVQLGADFASFNNLEIPDTLDSLRSGLIGEIEPLRRLGVSFDAAAVEAEAFTIAAEEGRQEITEGDKVLARYRLILEQSASAQGDFARTSDGLANRQRIVAAEFRDAQAQLGQALIPTLLTLADVFSSSLVPAVASAGEAIGPVLAVALQALTIALGPIVDLVGLVADGLGAIPAPVTAATLGVVGLTLAIRALGEGSVVGGLRNLPALFASLANPVTLGIAAIGGLLAILGSISRAREAEERRIEATREALFDEVDAREAAADATEGQQAAIQGLTSDLGKFIGTSEESRFVTRNQIDDLGRLGLTAEDVGEQIQGGEEGFRAFLEAAVAAGEIDLGRSIDSVDELIGQIDKFGDAESLLAKTGDTIVSGNTDLIRSFESVRSSVEEAGRRQLDARAAAGLLTEEQRKLAIELTRAADGTASFSAAAEFAENEMEVLVDRTGELTDQQAALLGRLDESTLSINRQSEDWQALIEAIGKGQIATEDYAKVAEQFGVPQEVIEQFAESAKERIADFTETLTGNVGAVSDAVDAIDGAFSPEKLIEQLRSRTEAIDNFQRNVRTLLDQGFTGLAQLALERGPEAGGIIAQKFVESEPEIRSAAEESLTGYQTAIDGLQGRIEGEFAPELAGANAAMAQDITDQFGVNLDVAGEAGRELDETGAVIGAKRPGIANAGGLTADALTVRFGQGASKLPGEAAAAFDASKLAIENRTGGVAGAGKRAGEKTAGEFGKGVGKTDDETRSALSNLGVVIDDAAADAAAENIGFGVGKNFGRGIEHGINAHIGEIRRAAARAVRNAEDAARREARSSSPSRLFADLGADLAGGIATGIREGGAGVVAAAEAIVRDAASTVVPASVGPAVSTTATTAPTPGGAAAGPGGATNITENITVNEVAEDPRATAAMISARLGRQARR